ncbi:insulinoma-associated protein 1a-like [Polyodon spathula]|uniref:insulinoma-associated protein 1a-like n=1 Tax=Polyodon spathula TaxID=7913 RepID=UPI001B7F6B81|nr:insulinoma-associated protein 1a-like [Polyodon spathula]
MPRGFLVKRTKKAGPVSYRVRSSVEDESAMQKFTSVISSTWARCPDTWERSAAAPTAPSSLASCRLVTANTQSVKSRIQFGGMPEALCAPSLSPNRPVSTEYPQQYPSTGAYLDRKRNSSSPIQAESFPEPSPNSFTSLGGADMAFLPPLADMATKLGFVCSRASSSEHPRSLKRRAAAEPKAKQPHSKKAKTTAAHSSSSSEKNLKDEVTTSPVLGLRIKEDPEEDSKPRSNNGSPLGKFICQLCKEGYSDPLSLAQHKCSRIVRVEYRCSECDKVFSCPANLASHRRWHKPRSAQLAAPSDTYSNTSSPGRHSLLLPHPTNKSGREASTPSPQPSDSGSDEELVFFDCPHCSKKFRRQAYLRKHLAVHNRPSAVSQQSQQAAAENILEKKPRLNQGTPQFATAAAATAPIYLGRDALLQPSAPMRILSAVVAAQAAEVYPCRFCPEKFFSSPGLTRHINKCHPTETRQVILLTQSAV